jgi:hypothetical protein
MGTDIHFYVEKKVNGKWVTADRWIDEEDWDGDNKIKFKRVRYEDSFYHDRNYDLFAILADVRNGYGFAGCVTGRGFTPISPPKGLPKDVSKEVQSESDRWNGDGHSHSWFTIAELDKYKWDQETIHSGVVNYIDFLTWKEKGTPNSWCGGVSGPNLRHVGHEEMEQAIKKNNAHNLYTRVEWKESYRDCAKQFLDEVMPKLRALGKPNAVRIVFWFDN